MENQNKPNKPNKETLEKWQKDPNNWIWGIFYYNKEDDRLIVFKKIEWMGTTFNFANPKWILYFIGFSSFFAFIIFMITRKH